MRTDNVGTVRHPRANNEGTNITHLHIPVRTYVHVLDTRERARTPRTERVYLRENNAQGRWVTPTCRSLPDRRFCNCLSATYLPSGSRNSYPLSRARARMYMSVYNCRVKNRTPGNQEKNLTTSFFFSFLPIAPQESQFLFLKSRNKMEICYGDVLWLVAKLLFVRNVNVNLYYSLNTLSEKHGIREKLHICKLLRFHDFTIIISRPLSSIVIHQIMN